MSSLINLLIHFDLFKIFTKLIYWRLDLKEFCFLKKKNSFKYKVVTERNFWLFQVKTCASVLKCICVHFSSAKSGTRRNIWLFSQTLRHQPLLLVYVLYKGLRIISPISRVAPLYSSIEGKTVFSKVALWSYVATVMT